MPCLVGPFAIVDLVRKSKRILVVAALLLALLPAPALIAPYVTDDPIAWAYRVYHPFMYRFPAVLGSHTTLELSTKSRLEQSLQVLRLMIRYW